MKVLISLLALATPVCLSAQTAPTPTAGAANPAQPPASPCAAAPHHQFDFWVGSWDVYGPAGRLIAHSLIEAVYGCGIRENWMPLRGNGGGSLNIYLPGEQVWQQFWIDGSGLRVILTGTWNGQAMVLNRTVTSAPQPVGAPMSRVSYAPNPDGSVRQFGEQSTDGGQTWTVTFDLTYRRRAAAAG